MVVKWIAGEENMDPFTITFLLVFLTPVALLVLVSLFAMFDGEDE
jgi:hypothetical protein